VGHPDEPRGFDATHVPHLLAVEDRHFWFATRNAVIASFTARLEGRLPSGYRVLEVGCGTGNTLRVLDRVCARGTVVGMDFQIEGLRHARKRTRRPLVQADVRRPPLSRDIDFDIVGMFDVLEHIENDRQVLEALRALTRPGGALLITVPAAPALWSEFDVAVHHRRRYQPADLREKLEAAGFRVEYVSPFMSLLFPFAWLQRKVHWRSTPPTGTDALCRDLRVVPGVNALLRLVLTMERPLLRARFHLPFGTSLMAVARAV
jgi:SAM-dependent methyltransferase